MPTGRNLSVLALSGCIVGVSAAALAINSGESQYGNIAVRNAFGLKPPPPPPPPEDQTPKDAPKLTLDGITTILGQRQVLLKAAFPAHPPQAAREESYLLAVNERAGDIEIVDIDEKAGTVKVNVRGLEGIQTLDFQHNGSKPPSGGAGPGAMAAAGPGVIPGRQMPIFPGSGVQAAQANAGYNAYVNATAPNQNNPNNGGGPQPSAMPASNVANQGGLQFGGPLQPSPRHGSRPNQP